jgi:hypothetical protein
MRVPDPLLFLRRVAVSVFYVLEIAALIVWAAFCYSRMIIQGRSIRPQTPQEKRQRAAIFERDEARHKRLWG